MPITLQTWCGVMKAIVVDNKDPEARGRIKVKVPDLMGDKVLPMWIEPKGGVPGMDWCPRVGDVVDVEPIPSASGLFTAPMVYSSYYGHMKDGKFAAANSGVSQLAVTRKIETEGWKVEIVEDQDNIEGYVEVSRPNKESPAVTIKASGDIEIKSDDGTVTFQLGGGGRLYVIADKIVLRGTVTLGAGGSHLTLFEELKQAFDSHTHTNGNQGAPTGPPQLPLPDTVKSKHEAD